MQTQEKLHYILFYQSKTSKPNKAPANGVPNTEPKPTSYGRDSKFFLSWLLSLKGLVNWSAIAPAIWKRSTFSTSRATKKVSSNSPYI